MKSQSRAGSWFVWLIYTLQVIRGNSVVMLEVCDIDIAVANPGFILTNPCRHWSALAEMNEDLDEIIRQDPPETSNTFLVKGRAEEE